MQYSYLRAAIEDARIATDERGLMPLAEARALVAATQVFERGEGRHIDGTTVLDADVVWAALLSLEDGAELVRHGVRMGWAYQVRGHDNVALVERYGHAVLPWIAHAVSPEGALTNVPWCRVACLLELDGEEAYRLAARVRSVRGSKKNRFTDVVNAPDEPILDAWVKRHPDEGLALLARDAIAGDGDAREALKRVAKLDPAGALEPVAAACGRQEAEALFKSLRLSPKVRSKKIRELLDAAETLPVASGPPVSLLSMDGHFREYRAPQWFDESVLVAGMRATGFAHPSGDALVLEALCTGGHDDNVRIELRAYGPTLVGEMAGYLDTEVEVVDGALLPERLGDYPVDDAGARVCRFELAGTERVVALPTERRARRDLDPGAAVLVALAEPPLRDAAFLPPAALAGAVGLPEDAVPVFVIDGWHLPEEGPASASIDLKTMVTALRLRKRITSVPKGTPNANYLKRRLGQVGWCMDDAVWEPE